MSVGKLVLVGFWLVFGGSTSRANGRILSGFNALFGDWLVSSILARISNADVCSCSNCMTLHPAFLRLVVAACDSALARVINSFPRM